MRKVFTGKTLDEILENARTEFGVEKRDLHYSILGEVKKLFSKKLEVECYTTEDIIVSVKDYVANVIKALDITVNKIESITKDREVKILVSTSDDALVIGKEGKNLRALTELARAYISAKFKIRMNIIVDVSGYKDVRYEKLEKMAIRIAKEVARTKIDAKLDPMSNDERKAIHQALSSVQNIKTESEGEGKYRHLVIKYSGN